MKAGRVLVVMGSCISLVVCGLLLFSCAKSQLQSSPKSQIGEPLSGLTPDQLQRFQAGEKAFQRVFVPEDGLGPLFNATSDLHFPHPRLTK